MHHTMAMIRTLHTLVPEPVSGLCLPCPSPPVKCVGEGDGGGLWLLTRR